MLNDPLSSFRWLEDDLIIVPTNIFELQPTDLNSSDAIGAQQQDHGIVAFADRFAAVYRTEQTFDVLLVDPARHMTEPTALNGWNRRCQITGKVANLM